MIINKSKLKYDGVLKDINKTKKYKGFPITNEYKYLGVVIDKDLRFKTMIDNYVKKTWSITGRLFPITSQGDFSERSFLFSVLNGPFVDQLWLPLNYCSNKNVENKIINEILWGFKLFTILRKKTYNNVAKYLLPFDIEVRKFNQFERILSKINKKDENFSPCIRPNREIDHDLRFIKKSYLKKDIKKLKFYPYYIDISANFSKIGFKNASGDRVTFDYNKDLSFNLMNLLNEETINF